ncbi:GNAT family N-acetyltransferase [Paenibacillus sp. UMB4589-SE434]|uniref:GNAT family N-acetyltransferase n=1 Tax=Paenibacillus sp. UMB4589-SE434 TaxID=3046314 RepID=UPI00254DFC4C|nr:GNAT family N-acetyltransferase [Paenibacillus sp. UMB4589-SE434]MDK8182361.1 GNAT family N-acetyltransferase [Paenibacillus sp. UMB4589-SE434]
MTNNKLPDSWESTNMIYNKMLENEIVEMQHLFSGSRYMNRWDGNEYNPQHINHCYYSGDLPPDGKKENYRIFTIKSKESKELIGMISLYHGYPTIESVYIVFIYIDQKLQSRGYGGETEAQLCKELIKLGYKYVRANIAIKNWPAVRFWTKAGFNGISGIFGDKIHSDNTFANIELIKTL